MTEKAKEFCLGEDYQTAFEALKNHLTTVSVLGYRLPEDGFILDTYSSNVVIEEVLLQI